jgi:hypothetical protein
MSICEVRLGEFLHRKYLRPGTTTLDEAKAIAQADHDGARVPRTPP